ncbi:MAG: alpha/beta hydrolase [Cyclobacteriaceae bacterium]
MRISLLKNVFVLAVTTLMLSGCARDSKIMLTVQLIDKAEIQAEQVFIAGNHQLLGGWDPGEIRMKKMANGIWEFEGAFAKDDALEYKFTRGSWQSEAVGMDGLPMPNYSLTIHSDTLLIVEVSNWRQQRSNGQGITGGEVRYHKDIKPDGLNQRDILVWLPDEYLIDSTKSYPVLYMHDGQNTVDPYTSFSGSDWGIDETADSLIDHGIIDPFILVGVYNTADRSDEYSPGQKGNAHMSFMVNQLKPMIDQVYRTKPDRKFTYVGGSSMGGIISLMLAWEYSDVYGGAICMSPAFKIGPYDYVDDVMDYDGPKKDLMLYIDNGGVDLEERLQPGIDEMLEALQDNGFVQEEDLFWVLDKTAEHTEKAWANRIGLPIRLFFGKK